MPAAAQQRLFNSSVSTHTFLQSKAVVDWVLCWLDRKSIAVECSELV